MAKGLMLKTCVAMVRGVQASVAHEPRSISAHHSSAMGSGASAVKAESDLLPEAPVLDKDEYIKEHHKLLGLAYGWLPYAQGCS